MKVNEQNHLLEGVRYAASPNADERPVAAAPELVVIHCISVPPGEYGGAGVEQLFTNVLDPGAHEFYREVCGLRVSAHLFIRRDGEVVQFVPFDKRAWHCGVSSYRGRERCNDFSVGIELEGRDDDAFEAVQYERLRAVLGALFDAYPTLGIERVAGHSDIAPGRKTDPGRFFDWHFMPGLARP